MEYKRGTDDPTMTDRKSLIPGPLRTFCTKTRAARTSYRRKRSLSFIHLKERLNENMTNEEGKSLQVSCLCTSYQRQYASTHEKEEKLIEILLKKKNILVRGVKVHVSCPVDTFSEVLFSSFLIVNILA